MAIGPIELGGTIARAQDIAAIKQTADAKPMQDQSFIASAEQKEGQNRLRQVKDVQQTDNYEYGFDAKQNSGQGYDGDGGKKRNKNQDAEEDGKVVVKQSRFDIKI